MPAREDSRFALSSASRRRRKAGPGDYYRPIPIFCGGLHRRHHVHWFLAMSHMTLEYSANLRGEGRFGELCRKLAQFMTALRMTVRPYFRPAACACGHWCEEYARRARAHDAGFVACRLKIGAREAATPPSKRPAPACSRS